MDNVHSPLDITSLANGYYSLCAVSADGVESDLSNPVLKTSYHKEFVVNVTDYRENHKDFAVEFEVPADGDYVIWFTGRNGRGPHNIYCAVRSLFLDGTDHDTIILEAFGDWNVQTLTNHVMLKDLKAGKHTLEVKLNPEAKGYDNNMSYNKENWNDMMVDTLNVAGL